MLGRATGTRSIAVYGGVSYGPQLEAFHQGVQLVVGTPGRVLDHLLRRSLTLSHLKILVFDEADRMLSMGFYPDMKRVQAYLPQHPINTHMFSATFPPHVLRLADQFMKDPVFLNLSSDHIHVTETEQVYYSVPGMDKDRSLIRIIEVENPASALIFCNTRTRVHYVTVVLQRFGYDADEISSDLTQGAREAIMQRVRQGSLRFLVATDVAARGIDLPELSHVILYEPPEETEGYIHRAGRTGRAGAGGTVISLVNANERSELLKIGRRYAIPLRELPLPSDEDVEQTVTQRAIALLEARLRARDSLKNERMKRFLPLVSSLSESDDEQDLLAMLVDDFYQDSFHGPLILPEGKSASQASGERRYSRPRRSSGRRRKSGK
jgi:ATP-dependent RNA helicase DeaD